MYYDTAQGTMLRFSKRDDVDRLYVNIVSERWPNLATNVGQQVTFGLDFPLYHMSYGTVGEVIDNGDKRWGFGGGENLAGEAVLKSIATSVSFGVLVYSSTKQIYSETVIYKNGKEAVDTLYDCSTARGGL